MNHIEFIEKNVREELLRQGFTQASRKGGMFDDVMRHANLWAEKQTSAAERREAKRTVRKGSNQAGLF